MVLIHFFALSLRSEVTHHLHAMLTYRAGRLLYPCLDPEGCSTDVLEAEELRFGDDPELTDASGFWRLHEHDLRTPHHLNVMDLHVPI